MKLSSIFSDNMVLQRDKEICIWGGGKPGDRVTVEFAGQRETANIPADGKWRVTLKPLQASSEPRDLSVKSAAGESEIRLRNVVVGDVWIASGQSNMEWPLMSSANAEAEMAAADHPAIRLFTVPKTALVAGQTDVNSKWLVCSPVAAREFAAVAYFFGRELHESLGIPIGLINSSWGGTRIQAWMSREALLDNPQTRTETTAYDRWIGDDKAQSQWLELGQDPVAWERKNAVADPGDTGSARGWASADFDDSAWPTMKMPSRWQDFGHDFSAVFWFRKVVDVPADWRGKDLVLNIGATDKHDTTFFNGTRVGGIGWETVNAWNTPRSYVIPADLVRPGKNVIATRVYSYMYHGGMIGPAEKMHLTRQGNAQPAIPLKGDWRFAIEHNLGLQMPVTPPAGDGNPQSPHILYDCMIAPLAPFGLAGAIWYQGESNAHEHRLYAELFPAMIRDWRRSFADPLPFFFVQLANYLELQEKPSEGGWAFLREAQTQTLAEPRTGMAVILDIGDAKDIHPTNKKDVGKRLAYAALAKVYGKSLVHSGPTYASHKINGGTVEIKLDHLADGLRTIDGDQVKGFALAGEDRKFHWAQAKITKDGVTLSSAEVAKPVAIRYGWANNPLVNLVNSAGLPAAPFRTDEWES